MPFLQKYARVILCSIYLSNFVYSDLKFDMCPSVLIDKKESDDGLNNFIDITNNTEDRKMSVQQEQYLNAANELLHKVSMKLLNHSIAGSDTFEPILKLEQSAYKNLNGTEYYSLQHSFSFKVIPIPLAHCCELRKLEKDSTVFDVVAYRCIPSLEFQTPSFPHSGKDWERLVNDVAEHMTALKDRTKLQALQ